MLCGLAICLVVALPGAAETVSPLAPLDTSSPGATMRTFAIETERIERAFEAYREDKTAARREALFQRAERIRALFDLSEVPPATRVKVGRESVGYLIDILLRLPELPPTSIPGAPGHDGELPARWTIPGTEISIARVRSGPHEGSYLFSADTVARLPEFHARIISQPPLRPTGFQSWREEAIRLTGPFFPAPLIASLPGPLLESVLGTPVWKLMFALLALAAILLLVTLWQRLAARVARRAGALRSLLLRMTTPALLAGLILALQAFIFYELNLSGLAAAAETTIALVLLYAAAAWLAWLACYLVVEAIIASPSFPDDSYDAHLLRLVARVVSLLAAGGVVAYGANDLGAPALGLVASLGVGGIAVALAAQSTIENLFGGVSIFADRPFRVGDFIRFGASSGTVEAIGPRSCRIRGEDGTVITATNGDLAKMAITNFAMRDKCLFSHRLALDPATGAAAIRALIDTLRAMLKSHALIESAPGCPRVHLTSLDNAFIGIGISAQVLTPSTTEFLAVQQHLILEIMTALEHAGVALAAPPGAPRAVRRAQAGPAVSRGAG